MYRNRAKAAHHLQSAAAVAPPPVGGAWNPTQNGQVPFFNPTSYQNGTAGQQNYYAPGGEQVGDVATAAAEEQPASWPVGWDQQNKLPPQENNNYYAADPAGGYELQPSGGYPPSVESGQVAVAASDYAANGQAAGDHASGGYYQQELTLDETGQWYYDFNQQQWFPYQQQQEAVGTGAEVQADQQVASISEDSRQQNNNQDYASAQLEGQLSVQDQNEHEATTAQEFDVSAVTNAVQDLTLQSDESHRREQHSNDRQAAYLELHDSRLSAGYAEAGPEDPGLVQRLPEPTSQYESSAGDYRTSSEFAQRPDLAFQPDHGATVAEAAPGNGPVPEGLLGPPDLVDHRPNPSQPEIVSDLNRAALSGTSLIGPPPGPPYASSVPPPDMFASLPGSASSSLPSSSHNTNSTVPDLTPSGTGDRPPFVSAAPDVMPSAPPSFAGYSGFAPDLTSQSVIHTGGSSHNAALNRQHSYQSPATEDTSVSSHDQHYDFYNRQFDPASAAMPDIMAGRGAVTGHHLSQNPQPPPLSLHMARPCGDSPQSCGKAPDILRTEPLLVVPSSDRNVYMETGELMEEDAARVTLQQPPQPHHLQHNHAVSPAFPKPSSGLPPMDGGNELLIDEVRMVVGESDAVATPANSSQRMVEGESSSSSSRPAVQVPSPPTNEREVEGEPSVTETLLSVANRTIEGEDGPPSPAQLPPPAPPLSSGPPTAVPLNRSGGPSAQTTCPPPPLSSAASGGGRVVAPGFPSPQHHHQGAAANSRESPSLFSSTILDSSPIYPPGHTEARSAAAGSERRDQSVMGGPPPPRSAKLPPMPTPGRDIAGEEAAATSVYSGARRRGDEHKKSTYDSDDVDRNEDSDLESDRDREPRYPQPRRTVSPGARSGRLKPSRPLERYHRSSTDRDEDSDRRGPDYYRDRRDDSRRYRDDYDYEGSRRYRDGRGQPERRDRYRDPTADESRYRESFRREDRHERTFRGRGDTTLLDGTLRYRDDKYRRGGRQESDLDVDSCYGEDLINRSSRPSSRAGSMSHYDPNESYYGRSMLSMPYMQQQYMQQQLMQQYAMLNPLQYQLQSAVREMEKALQDPQNVAIYKQHWDVYTKQPMLLEKLKLENPIMYHLLQHFRQNFWHLVEEKKADPNLTSQPARASSQASLPIRTEFEEEGGAEEEEELRGNEESYRAPAHRLTPLMFTRPHVCARISSSGLLVKVEAASPQDGQNATVELHSMAALLSHTREYKQLLPFPGPLKPGDTHKNDVIKFCEKKIHDSRDRRMLDKESYVLLWNMLILLLRQKGQVEGSDLADLLLSDRNRVGEETRRSSRASSFRMSSLDIHQQQLEDSSTSSTHNDEGDETVATSRSHINPGISQEESVNKFRSYLLHGNKQEGLEYAMKAGLWGHALFLASKMDQRTYAGVMTRFANGLAINDPLQTLYQLMSSRMPAAMKHCADQRWGDWRPHLAMILSNPSSGSDINRRSILTLGDTLASKGLLYAAQFCYIVSAVEFGTYTKKSSKLVLLCSSVGDKSVEEFATNEAIQCTEIYEFVQLLGNHEYEMPTLQPFKLLHAVRLCEVGLVSRAQDYCREIAGHVTRPGARIETDFLPDFLSQLLNLAERLKYQDPVYTTSSGEWNEIPDPDWLVRLRQAVEASYCQEGHNIQAAGDEAAPASFTYDPSQQYYDQQQYSSYNYTETTSGGQETEPLQEAGQPASAADQQLYHQETDMPPQTLYEQQQQPYAAYGDEAVGGTTLQSSDTATAGPHSIPASQDQQQQPVATYSLPGEQADNFSAATTTGGPPPFMFNPTTFGSGQPGQSSLGGRSRQASLTETALVASQTSPSVPPVQTKTSKSNDQISVKEKPAAGKNSITSANNNKKTSSWLGGIFGKFVRASNQVHLPDDSDKKIVFDEKVGRWVNLDGDQDDLAPAAPPPMDPAFAAATTAVPSVAPGAGTAAPLGSATTPLETSPTGFRAQPGKRRGRGYVDVFSQAGATKPLAVSPMLLDPMLPPGGGSQLAGPAPPPAIFNPTLTAPSSDDAIPSGVTSSSVPEGDSSGQASMPMMFNPSYMATVSAPPSF